MLRANQNYASEAKHSHTINQVRAKRWEGDKVLGIINSDWKDGDGGGFQHDGTLHKLLPGDFIVFNPRLPHKAEDIITDKKRIAIDWTIRNG